MIVGIDLRCLPTDGGAGAGVAHAARFLTDALLSKDVPWSWRLYVPSARDNVPLGTERWAKRSDVVRLPDDRGVSLRAALRSHPCDLLFVPSGAIAPGISIPSIPWVHDLTIYSHPEWFPQSFLRRAMTTRIFRHGVAAAPIVFAVSEDTKRELVRLFGSDADRVRVTYEGGDPFLETLYGPSLESQKRDAKRKVATAGIAHPFVLALGTVEPRKNLALLIAAWEDARISSVRPTDLVIAGRDGWNMEPVRDAIRPHIVADEGMGRLHRLEAVDDDMRRDLLLAADLVALPSLHEGFGLVALEAMQAGTALLASRAGAIPEVVGESGILIDPNDLGAWKDALVRLMSDDENRTEVARLGKARSQGFTWDRAAKTVIEGLEGIV